MQSVKRAPSFVTLLEVPSSTTKVAKHGRGTSCARLFTVERGHHPPIDHQNPDTVTGVGLSVVVPLPNWP